MAHRAFVLAKRNDVNGMNIQVLDLKPNSSQKNGVYDGDGQTFYLETFDMPGATTMVDNGYVSGSRFTTMSAYYDATADDTTGGGNDVLATQHAALGLAAYLRERVQPGGIALATAARMTWAHANQQAGALIVQYGNGLPLTLVGINAILSDVGSGGVAQTDLNGASGFSRSFGAVEDILRMLSGEVYRSPMYCIITNVANQFLNLTQRNILVAAQDSTTTGKTFVSQGGFLSNTEHGYTKIPTLAITGEMFASIGAGYLHKLAVHGMTFKNPNFAYSAAEVTPFKPRAYFMTGAAVPTTGAGEVLRVYDHEGVCLL